MKITKRQLRKIIREEMAHPQSGLGNGCEIEAILFLLSIGRGIGPPKEPLPRRFLLASGPKAHPAFPRIPMPNSPALRLPFPEACP